MNKRGCLTLLSIVLAIGLFRILLGCFFAVYQTEQVIITQFGKPVGEPITDPGLHFKLPIIQEVNRIDKRFLEWDGMPVAIPTRDKTYIHVDTFARWRISDAKTHVRVTNLIFPHAFTIPMSSEMTITQWHVPIGDEKHYWYAIFTSFGAPVNRDEMRRQRLALYELPDYIPRKNRTNNYGFDPHEQEDETFTGMGTDINVHDQWACESMGPIADRTREHLGQSDKAISAYRRILRNAIDAASNGHKPLMVLDAATAAKLTGPAAIDGIGPSGAWQTYWRKTDEARRRSSGWAAPA